MVRNAYVTLAFALLASCGGGSGGGSAPVTLPTTPAPSPTPSATPTPTPTPSTSGGGYVAYADITAARQFETLCAYDLRAFRSKNLIYTPSNRSYELKSVFFGDKIGPQDLNFKTTFSASDITSSTAQGTFYNYQSGDVTSKLNVDSSELGLSYSRRLSFLHITPNGGITSVTNFTESYYYCTFGNATKYSEISESSFSNFTKTSAQGRFVLGYGGTSDTYTITDSRVELLKDPQTGGISLSVLLRGKTEDGKSISVGPYKYLGSMDTDGVFQLFDANTEVATYAEALGRFYGPNAAELGVVFRYSYRRPGTDLSVFVSGTIVGTR